MLSAILKRHRDESESVFVVARGDKPVEPRAFQHRFKKVLEDAGLRDVNYHATRHTFSTRALENDFDVKTLSEILGHSTPAVTLNRYAHSHEKHKREKMETLAREKE
jgi:integrase